MKKAAIVLGFLLSAAWAAAGTYYNQTSSNNTINVPTIISTASATRAALSVTNSSGAVAGPALTVTGGANLYVPSVQFKDLSGNPDFTVYGSGDVVFGSTAGVTLNHSADGAQIPTGLWYDKTHERLFLRSIIMSEYGDPPEIAIQRSSSTTPGVVGQVAAGENLGLIYWRGGTELGDFNLRAAQIYARAATEVTESSAPGRLYLGTQDTALNPDNDLNIGLMIDEYQRVCAGCDAATADLDVTPSGVSGSLLFKARDAESGGNTQFSISSTGTVLIPQTTGKLGINTSTPLSKLDVSGNAAFGTYAGATAAPTNGLIVSGSVGIGLTGPDKPLHVIGTSGRVVSYPSVASYLGQIVENNANSGIGIVSSSSNVGGLFFYGSGDASALGQIFYRTNSDQMEFVANGSTALLLDPSQNVITGDTGAGAGGNAKFTVVAGDNLTAASLRINATQANVTTNDVYLGFYSNTGLEGSVAGTAVAGVIAFNTFTGAHWTSVKKFKSAGDVRENILAPLCSTGEPFKSRTFLDAMTGDKKKIRVSEKEQLVRTEPCTEPYAKAVYGFYAGRDDKMGFDISLSLGTGVAWVANTGVDVDPGDWLVTTGDGRTVQVQLLRGSQTPVKDDLHRNYSVAKASQSIKWKKGEQRRKIAVTYHAG